MYSCSNNKTADTAALPSSQTVHANAADTIVTSSKPVVLAGCYQMVLQKDTATLQLDIKDSTVNGQLNYYFFEKDRNEGQIKGVLRNDIIVADYTFQSEGTTSVREVVFKIKQDTLLQGSGDIIEQNGKVVFKNRDALQFHASNPFVKVGCP
jgi:hypothetical protein